MVVTWFGWFGWLRFSGEFAVVLVAASLLVRGFDLGFLWVLYCGYDFLAWLSLWACLECVAIGLRRVCVLVSGWVSVW